MQFKEKLQPRANWNTTGKFDIYFKQVLAAFAKILVLQKS